MLFAYIRIEYWVQSVFQVFFWKIDPQKNVFHPKDMVVICCIHPCGFQWYLFSDTHHSSVELVYLDCPTSSGGMSEFVDL